MRRQSGPPVSAEQHTKTIRRATRKKYLTEEKIRVVLSGLRGEYSITELCRREGIAHLKAQMGVSERRACSIVGADRKMARYRSRRPPETALGLSGLLCGGAC